MRILTPDNMAYDMNELPDQIDDIRFCALDYSNPAEIDYYFTPLIFLESFSSPAADLQIGPYRIQIPLDWSIVIGDKHLGDLEIIQLMNLNDRDFTAFSINPIKGYMPNFFDVDIINVYTDVKWYTPKLKYGNLLAVPLAPGYNPYCLLIVKDTNKLPDILDITHLV